ncbi:MAG TPA: Ig-like domain repeat protein [Gemmataceae bacterium]|nr:Ig-like domain repeat protein [Gemmataceae bacterium]
MSTQTSLATSANPALAGQSVVFTATITGAPGAQPSGVVVFLDGSTSIGQGSVSTSGGTTTASFSTSSLAAGSHNLAAYYTGDSSDAPSVGRLTQTVNTAGSNTTGSTGSGGDSGGQGKTATSTSVVASANPSLAGQSVTFTATVTGAPGAQPGGVVVFLDGSTSIGQGSVSTSGGTTTASFSTSSLAAGSHNLAAYYTGDSSDAPSVGRLTQVVNQEDATILTVSATTVPVGQPLTLVATVSLASAENSTGSVTFFDENTSLGTVPLGGGSATFTTSSLSLGRHSLSAVYTADSDQTTHSSAPVTVTVGTPNQRFVVELYMSLLQRQPDAGGLTAWTAVLDQGVGRTQAALAIQQSHESRGNQVDALYERFLHRKADSSGLNAYVALLFAGGTLDDVRIALTSSSEYLQARGGGTNNGYVMALYEDALNRSPDAGGLATFSQALNQGLTPRQIAAAIFSSKENLQDLIGAYYQQFLNRAADNSGLSAYVQAMQAGTQDQTVIAVLLGSDEFYSQV